MDFSDIELLGNVRNSVVFSADLEFDRWGFSGYFYLLQLYREVQETIRRT